MSEQKGIEPITSIILERLKKLEGDINNLSQKLDERFHELSEKHIGNIYEEIGDLNDRLIVLEQGHEFKKKGMNWFLSISSLIIGGSFVAVIKYLFGH